ncbi:hypothetical protein ES703_113998 [subsurface metagenome]
MTLNENVIEKPMKLSKQTRERAKAQIIENLTRAGVLLRGEAARYEKVLDSYDNRTLVSVMEVSHELRIAAGEILT